MIPELDAYIVNKIKRIKTNGESIRVLLDYPERETGKAKYPCVAVVRLDPEIDTANQRPSCSVSIPSDEQTSVMFDGEQFNGPVSWLHKPYPVPVRVSYDILTYATTKADANYLYGAIYQVLPPNTATEIEGQFPYFVYSKSATFGDLDQPMYGINFVLNVHDVFINRIEAMTIPSLTNINIVITPEHSEH